MKRAIVLLSGGLDSTIAAYLAKSQGFDELYALTFLYGQKHHKELDAAKSVANIVGVKEHKIIELLLNQWNGCSLTDASVKIGDGDIHRTEIPDTYVPADYDEVFSRRYADEVYFRVMEDALMSPFTRYLEDPIFDEQAQAKKKGE